MSTPQTLAETRRWLRLSAATHLLLGLLVIELLLGVYVAAMVTLPSAPLTFAQYLKGQGNAGVVAHTALTAILLLVGLVVLALAATTRKTGVIIDGVFGLAFLALAATGGYRFLFVTYQSPSSLALMIAGFVGALLAYAIALVTARRSLRAAPPDPAPPD
ncbi:MAG: hypothetical protein ACYCPN_01860 [Thermoplasmata archaeon]